jgi:hypothetical protein
MAMAKSFGSAAPQFGDVGGDGAVVQAGQASVQQLEVALERRRRLANRPDVHLQGVASEIPHWRAPGREAFSSRVRAAAAKSAAAVAPVRASEHSERPGRRGLLGSTLTAVLLHRASGGRRDLGAPGGSTTCRERFVRASFVPELPEVSPRCPSRRALSAASGSESTGAPFPSPGGARGGSSSPRSLVFVPVNHGGIACPGVYERLGVAVIVNGKGPATRLSGGVMHPEVAAAMVEASGACVDMVALQAAAARRIAAVTGAESGVVTSRGRGRAVAGGGGLHGAAGSCGDGAAAGGPGVVRTRW